VQAALELRGVVGEPYMSQSWRGQLATAARTAGAVALAAARMLWRIVRMPLIGALNVLAALVLLFEEWGWRPLSAALARLARFRLWAELELWIAGLPPYGAIVALGVPSAVLIPAKFAGVYLLATGHLITAAAVIVAAKIASTALIARIFMLTRPALMQVAWFKHAYDVFMPWHDRVVGWIRNSWVWRYGRIVKWRAGGTMRRTWRALRPHLEHAAAVARLRVREAARRVSLLTRGHEPDL
jgi:hypothetical protein